jgi:hypothetical protein
METAGSFEILKITYQTARCHNPEDHNINQHGSENLKSNIVSNLGGS